MSSFGDEDIVLAPAELVFEENDTSEQLMSIENWSEEYHAVFRVKSSVSNLFVLGEAGGVVEASTAVEFPISLKNSIPPDFTDVAEIPATLTIELVPWTEEFDDAGVRAFWATHGRNALRKSVECTVHKAVSAEASVDSLRSAFQDRAQSMPQGASFSEFDVEGEAEEHLNAIPEEDEREGNVEQESLLAVPMLEPVAEFAALPVPIAGTVESEEEPPQMNFLAEMRSKQESGNNGLKKVEAASPHVPPRRRSMLDTPSSLGMSVFEELRETQERLAGGELRMKHVHTKTAAEKEQERLAALATVPEGGFTNIMDELKHFSYMLSQSTVEATSDPVLEVSRNRIGSEVENQNKELVAQLVEKDTRISELNAEIHRLMEQHEAEVESLAEQKSAKISALEKQSEAKLVSLAAQHGTEMRNSTEEHASRVASLSEHYESRIAALIKQQEEAGGHEEMLEQQRVVMEAFTKAKENEIKDTIMHQELKFTSLMQNQEARIAELTMELEDLKRDKEEEARKTSEAHVQKVNNLMKQHSVLISTLSTQVESTMKVQHERAEGLNRELANLHQKKLAEAASLRQQYDAKIKAYTAHCEDITRSLQAQVDDLQVRLQNAEFQNRVHKGSGSFESLPTYNEPPPQHLYSPPPPQTRSQHQLSPVQSSAPPPLIASNPFLSKPSAGGRPGPARPSMADKPHYATSVRQLRRPDTSESSRELTAPARPPPQQQRPQPAVLSPPAEGISVAPSTLRFIAGINSSEDHIILHNTCEMPVAFKVRVSVKNIFTLPDAGGVLMGGELKRLPVIMKESVEYTTVDSIPKAKFLVELISADESYNTLGAKGFWESKDKNAIVKKQIVAEYQIMK